MQSQKSIVERTKKLTAAATYYCNSQGSSTISPSIKERGARGQGWRNLGQRRSDKVITLLQLVHDITY